MNDVQILGLWKIIGTSISYSESTVDFDVFCHIRIISYNYKSDWQNQLYSLLQVLQVYKNLLECLQSCYIMYRSETGCQYVGSYSLETSLKKSYATRINRSQFHVLLLIHHGSARVLITSDRSTTWYRGKVIGLSESPPKLISEFGIASSNKKDTNKW